MEFEVNYLSRETGNTYDVLMNMPSGRRYRMFEYCVEKAKQKKPGGIPIEQAALKKGR